MKNLVEDLKKFGLYNKARKQIQEIIGKHLEEMLKGFCISQLTPKGQDKHRLILEMFVDYVKSGGQDITMKK